jgi:hypothetical protein
MARPIAYNASGPLSGSIRGGSVNYTIDGAGRDYTTFAGKKWVPSADGAAPIVFVTDSFTRGLTTAGNAYPLFFSCAGTSSAAILYTANRLPGSPGNFTNTGSAFNDLTATYGYFILESNDPFDGSNADSLTLDLDASKISSYPQTGTNWRDLSGAGGTGTLTNNPTWNSNGWFEFDGTDDYVLFTTPLGSTNTVSVEMICKIPASYVDDMFFGWNGYDVWCNGGSIGYNTNNGDLYGISSATVSSLGLVNNWKQYIFEMRSDVPYTNNKIYVNGIPQTLSQQLGSEFGGNRNFNSGNGVFPGYRASLGNYLMAYQVSSFKVYPKSLSQSEIKQNYFGAPIVTNGLVFAIDANNLVSYPKSGTAWYNLTSSLNSGSLVNGPTFSPSNGGSIVFDGTDDYISTNFTQTFTDEVTIECWYKGTKSSRNHLWTLGRYAGNTNLTADFNDGLGLWIYWNGGGSPAIRYTGNFTDNTIKHLVFTHSGSVNKTYLNGELLTPYDVLGTQTFSPAVGGVMEIGSFEGTSLPFGGNVYSYRVYNKGLTATEIQQNYQAEQYRFETPAGPVTNGLVLYWDAGNLDSYPGTGTTIYDLSGNGNNGTLVNGVGYNQTNGGVLTFDGVDDYVISYNPNLSNTTSTVMGAARYSGGTRGRMINSTDVNWLIGHWTNSTENYYALGWVSPVQYGANDTNWRIYAALGDQPGDSYSSYVNNTLSYGPNSNGSSGPDGISIGAQTYSGTSEFSTGQFSFVLVYNRILTAAEMTQNYNYFKGRFGL